MIHAVPPRAGRARQSGKIPAVTAEFFLGAMSPYSWLSAERIGNILPDAEWRPVYLGGLFKANGRTSWGLTPERTAGMRECEARAAAYGLGPIRWPDPWPTDDLFVARAMVFTQRHGLLQRFALAAMRLAFREGVDIGRLDAMLESGVRVGIDAGELAGAVEDRAIKAELRAVTERTAALGVFGVPTVRIGETLLWGYDRLEEAATHARSTAGG